MLRCDVEFQSRLAQQLRVRLVAVRWDDLGPSLMEMRFLKHKLRDLAFMHVDWQPGERFSAACMH